MADLPWPKSTARSSTSAIAFAIQNPDQQQGALVSDPDASTMHQDDIGGATFPTENTVPGTPSYISVDAASTYTAPMGGYLSVPFAPSQERRACTSHPPEMAHSFTSQDRAVHTIQVKIWNLDSPHRALFTQEINQYGYIKQFEPEFFFLKLTGDQTLANRLADYWRQFYGIPTVHPGSPFVADVPQHVQPQEVPTLSISTLASQLLTRAFGTSLPQHPVGSSPPLTSSGTSATAAMSPDQLQALAIGGPVSDQPA